MRDYLMNKYGLTLTFEQAGQELHLNPRTVQNLCARGEIKAKKMGRKWLLTAESIAEYLERPLLILPPVVNGRRKLV